MEVVRILPSLSVARVSPDRKLGRSSIVKITTFTTRKLLVSMCVGSESSRTSPGFEAGTTLKYTEDGKEELIDESTKPHLVSEPTVGEIEAKVPLHEENDLKPKKYAKIHDFCLGIPFGGFVFGGGVFGFLFSRNPASLSTGVLYGGAILAMGVISLKVWRQGISSLPLILGQAALAATLLWKYVRVYSLTKKTFPSGLYVAMSAAMICFYAYVLIAGGNPPPKKKRAAASQS